MVDLKNRFFSNKDAAEAIGCLGGLLLLVVSLKYKVSVVEVVTVPVIDNTSAEKNLAKIRKVHS